MKLSEKLGSLFSKDKNSQTKEVNILPEMEESEHGLLVSSNGYFTNIEKKSENIFAIWDIEWDKNQILELADFINNAQSIIHSGIFADNDSYVDSVSFSYNPSRPEIAPEIIFGITNGYEYNEDGDADVEGYGKPVSLWKSARKNLSKDSFIKQNIEKIASYMDTYIKDRKLDNIQPWSFWIE